MGMDAPVVSEKRLGMDNGGSLIQYRQSSAIDTQLSFGVSISLKREAVRFHSLLVSGLEDAVVSDLEFPAPPQ
jgi:hypothetical protein